jgi:hypothetical protein|tara:strand:+ start:10492 stop:13167 length:2676 start_codon:yes stop_codon:yes gene_type:complete
MPSAVKAKVSTVVGNQIPDFITDDSNNFKQFLEAYYEWMQTVYLPQSHLENIRDIDTTVDMFVEHFKNDIMQPIPEQALTDKRLLAKRIQDIYRSKGTEQSYKFLFRILFNEDAELFFPKTALLRPSSGTWSARTVIRITDATGGDPLGLIGQTISQTQAVGDGTFRTVTGFVENAVSTQIGSKTVTDLTMDDESITSTFEAEDEFNIKSITATSLTTGATITATVVSIITGFNITDGGSYYDIGDLITIVSPTGSEARGEITEIDSGSVTGVTIENVGAGYKINDEIIFDNLGTGGPGSNAALSARASVTNIDRDSVSLESGNAGGGGTLLQENNFDIDLQEAPEEGAIKQVTVLTGGAFYDRLPTLTLPTGGNRTGGKVVATSTSIGKLRKIELSRFGIDYKVPPIASVPAISILQNVTGSFNAGDTVTLTAQSFSVEDGSGGVLLESGDNMLVENQQVCTGTVRDFDTVKQVLKVDNPNVFLPFALEDGSGRMTTETRDTFVQEQSGFFADSNTVTSSSGGSGKIIDINYPSITTSVGATGTGLGGYLTADGFISESSKKIQDSRFYQDFSYVVQVGQSIDQYKDAVKKLLHPIGLALFGEVQIQTILASLMGDINDTEKKRYLVDLLLQVIIDGKLKAVGNYRPNSAAEHRPDLPKQIFSINLEALVDTVLNLRIQTSDFVSEIEFPNLTPAEVNLLELSPLNISVEDRVEIANRTAYDLQKPARNPVVSLPLRSSQPFDGSVRRAGFNLIDLDRYKFTFKPSVAGTKYSNSEGTPAFTTNGLEDDPRLTYPNPNSGYYSQYGNTQIKDFSDVTVASIINSPYTQVSYAIESEIGIFKQPASGLRFSTQDPAFTFDDIAFTFDADSVEFDTTAYNFDSSNLKWDLLT